MAKNIYMIAPFDVLTGNLGSKQDLRYKLHDNKAFEAPDGVAGAKNYRTRYIGVRRADGRVYFAVKTKSTTNLNAKTRMTMAVLGVVAAMKSALKTAHAADWAQLQKAYVYMVEHELSVPNTFDKWIDREFGTMLRYKQTQVSYTIAAASVNVTVVNPYEESATALVISAKIWTKFYDVFGLSSGGIAVDTIGFSIDGKSFVAPTESTWEDILDASVVLNANMRASYSTAGITIPTAGANPLYNGQPIYNATGVVQTGETALVADMDYTTIAPTA